MFKKGIILAGGTGKRIDPLSRSVSKQLLPVYDKPMIYYPLTTLMLAGVREILIITNLEYIDCYKNLFGNGNQLGLEITYQIQKEPKGVAEAFIIGEKFIKDDDVALILGDNIFNGNRLISLLKQESTITSGATIFAYKVQNPINFSVIEFSNDGEIIGLEEKPKIPKSDFAITGLYFYDNSVIDKAKSLKPSKRGELEINDLNLIYLKEKQLKVEFLGRGIAWLDTGTFESINEASCYVRAIQNIQGLKIGSPEEVAWRLGLIDDEDLFKLATPIKGSGYGEYLLKFLEK